MRTCVICGVSKPRTDFYKHPAYKDGLDKRCKMCFYLLGRKYSEARGLEWELLHSAKTRAKKKDLSFNLDSSDIVIPDRCPVLDIELRSDAFTGNGKHCNNSPSLDRIDNNRGYVKGNVMVISYKANRLKSDLSPEEVGAMIQFLRDPRLCLDLIGTLDFDFQEPPSLQKPVGPSKRCTHPDAPRFKNAGCCKRCYTDYNREQEVYRGPEHMMLSCARRRARRLNIPFSLTGCPR